MPGCIEGCWIKKKKDPVTGKKERTIMLEAGESVVTRARGGLGHTSPTITFDYYAHFMPEAGNNGRAVVDGVLRTLGAPGERGGSRNSPDTPQR